MKLSQAIEGFFLEKRLDCSEKTMAKYSYVFQRFVDFTGDLEIANVTSVQVRLFLNHLRLQHKELPERRELSKRTLHDYWAPLSSLWTWAERELEIANVIKGKVPAPNYKERIVEPFTDDEVRRLLKATEQGKEWTTKNGKVMRTKRPTAMRDKAILLTLLDTGMRASELCNLTIGDYDNKRGRLHIRHGKGDKERYTVIGVRTQKAVWKYLTTRESNRPKSPLFIATSDGDQRMSREGIWRLVAGRGAASGVSNAHPHRFRHTFAIEFLRNGGGIFVLKELLGHEKLEMVMKYVQLAQQDLDASMKHSPADNWRL